MKKERALTAHNKGGKYGVNSYGNLAVT